MYSYIFIYVNQQYDKVSSLLDAWSSLSIAPTSDNERKAASEK